MTCGAGPGDEDREELTPHFIYSTDIRRAPLCRDPHAQIHWQTPSTVCLVLTDCGDCDDCLPGLGNSHDSPDTKQLCTRV